VDYCDGSVRVFDLFKYNIQSCSSKNKSSHAQNMNYVNTTIQSSDGACSWQTSENIVTCIHCYQHFKSSNNYPKNYSVSAQKLTRI